MERGNPILVQPRSQTISPLPAPWGPRGKDYPLSKCLLHAPVESPAEEVGPEDDGTGDKEKEKEGGEEGDSVGCLAHHLAEEAGELQVEIAGVAL